MRESARILVVDDEEDLRLGLAETLQGEGHQVETAGDGWAALEQARSSHFDLALVDLKMPGPDGMIVLDQLKQLSPKTLVVVITGHATVESAVAAMKLGAYDYLSKPFKLDQVRLVVRRAAEQKRLSDENRRLRQEVESYHRFEQIVGKSACMQELFRAIEKAAPTNSTVLISGETGTGKDLVARALHQRSPRAKGPLVPISCGAIPEALLESELFGHVKGAFTGAIRDKVGRFEQAAGGSIFLDEIGDLSLSVQVKLLRVLQEKEIERVGSGQTLKVDTRVIAATHRNLQLALQQGTFRSDLYYRLNVMPLELPPLRQRKEDIPLLVEHFIAKFNAQTQRRILRLDDAALSLLMDYDWPGNVRELENAIEHAFIKCRGEVLLPHHLPTALQDSHSRPQASAVLTPTVEKEQLLRVLTECHWNRSLAATRLGMHRTTLWRKMREWGIPAQPRS